MKHRLLAVAATVLLSSCSRATLPPIKGHHWHRSWIGEDYLYKDSDGTKSAAIFVQSDGSAHVYAFEPTATVEDFDSEEDALKWIAKRLEEH